MLFPENGNNFQRSMWYRKYIIISAFPQSARDSITTRNLFHVGTSRDCPDSDLHCERRMENDNHRHSRQDSRKDHLRDQPLHDHSDLYTAHNRRFKGKEIFSLYFYTIIKYRRRIIKSHRRGFKILNYIKSLNVSIFKSSCNRLQILQKIYN